MKEEKKNFPVIDGHVDLIYELMRHHPNSVFRDLRGGPVTLDNIKQGRVRVVVVALYCEDQHNGPISAEKRLRELMACAECKLQPMLLIGSKGDLEECFKKTNTIGVLFLLENGDALIDMDIAELESRSIYVVGLTHAGRNRIGEGNAVRRPQGLSRQGRSVVKSMNERGFALDVAHLSDPCFWQVIDIFDGPIISTHTGFRSFHNIPRNLGDDQIKIIIEKRGLLGVTVNPEMLSPDGVSTIHTVFRHIDWIVQHHGPQHVALGSDFCGFDVENQGLRDMSEFTDLAEMLIKHGYAHEAVSDIMGGNWYNFYESLLAGA